MKKFDMVLAWGGLVAFVALLAAIALNGCGVLR